MRILETKNNYNYTKPQAPRFKAWRRLVLDINQPYIIGEKPKLMNNTLFFRNKKIWEEKIAKILNLDYMGVDLMYGENGEPILCEVNSNAFFEGMEKATNINVAKAYAEYVLSAIKG